MSVQPDATAAANVGLDEVIDASRGALSTARSARFMQRFAMHGAYPARNHVASATLLQAEGSGVLVDCTSEANQDPQRLPKLTSLSQRMPTRFLLYARASPAAVLTTTRNQLY